MGGVKKKSKSSPRRAVSFISYYQISISGWFEKKNSGKKKAVATTTRSTCDWSAEILTKSKGSERKKEIRNEFIIILG
jgi:hypothetical protein